MKAPWGVQQDWYANTYDRGFRTYMACGNTNDEGESGATYNTLMIVNSYNGFDIASVDEESVNEK